MNNPAQKQMRAPVLDAPIASLPKVSRAILPALKRLGIETLRDLLFHFPARYEEFPAERPIARVAAGESVTIKGVIRRISGFRSPRKGMHITEAAIADASGTIQAVWFNQRFLEQNLKTGSVVRLSGKAVRNTRGLTLQNPSHEKATGDKRSATGSPDTHTKGLVAMYPETYGITSRWLRFLIRTHIGAAEDIPDPLPQETLARHGLPGLAPALRAIHAPDTRESALRAEKRFIFEETLLLQLRSLRERARLKQRSAREVPFDVSLIKEFVASLPFRLTDAQRRAIWEIGTDMAKSQPMNRLLEGDVGSGKTVVAAAAALLAVRAGGRVACMAPTEILARQHHATFTKILTPFQISLGLLTGAKKEYGALTDIVIGTHALLHREKDFTDFNLVLVDEQHRFGVNQRAKLLRQETSDRRQEKSDKTSPLLVTGRLSLVAHFLSMTATPIPRTLALAVYGDLDLSLLDEMPQDRKEIITRIVSPGKRREAYAFIRAEVSRGRQAFLICPRIDADTQTNTDLTRTNAETDPRKSASRPRQSALWTAEVKTVTDEYKKLTTEIFPDLRIAMLHGRMKAKEKDAIMQKFRARDTDILVSTSVIEVGVDVPNATIMMIEGADRFGLAQLHQFRGRVGRGSDQSYCFLFPTEDGTASRRLHAVVEARNGFELAEKDLAIRGPGDIFGTRQWGEAGLAVRGVRDPKLVRDVRQEAVELARQSPDLSAYPALAERLTRMEKTLHLE